MEITSTHISVVVGIIAIIGAILSLARAFNTQTEAIRAQAITMNDGVKTQLNTEVGSLRRETNAELDKRDAQNSRSRHDQDNRTQQVIGKLELDVKTLARETLRKDEMQAVETRLTAVVGKLETKIDNFAEKIPAMHGFEQRLRDLDGKLVEIVNRTNKAQGM